jgi:hypothetical protein
MRATYEFASPIRSARFLLRRNDKTDYFHTVSALHQKIVGYLLFISGNKPRKKKRSRKIVLLSLMEVASFFRPVFLRAEKR